VFIKVCGLRRAEDVECAVTHGATAVGFIFWPRSPRYVDPERAGALVRLVPKGVATVGVFVNEPAEAIRNIASHTGVSMVQLHGDEPPEIAAQLDRPVLKAMGVEVVRDTAWPVETTVLLDVTDHARRGGTGQLVDWAQAAAVARVRPVVLAGGLVPDNVADAIAAVRPYGVDVSSGVEDEPGIKNAGRMQLFLERARAAFEREQRRQR
jgi:phosphoribosylanthranilate isomerase